MSFSAARVSEGRFDILANRSDIELGSEVAWTNSSVAVLPDMPKYMVERDTTSILASRSASSISAVMKQVLGRGKAPIIGSHRYAEDFVEVRYKMLSKM
jgi:hypothetical protein